MPNQERRIKPDGFCKRSLRFGLKKPLFSRYFKNGADWFDTFILGNFRFDAAVRIFMQVSVVPVVFLPEPHGDTLNPILMNSIKKYDFKAGLKQEFEIVNIGELYRRQTCVDRSEWYNSIQCSRYLFHCDNYSLICRERWRTIIRCLKNNVDGLSCNCILRDIYF